MNGFTLIELVLTVTLAFLVTMTAIQTARTIALINSFPNEGEVWVSGTATTSVGKAGYLVEN